MLALAQWAGLAQPVISVQRTTTGLPALLVPAPAVELWPVMTVLLELELARVTWDGLV